MMHSHQTAPTQFVEANGYSIALLRPGVDLARKEKI